MCIVYKLQSEITLAKQLASASTFSSRVKFPRALYCQLF